VPEVEASPKAELTRITDNLAVIARRTYGPTRATLLALDTTYEIPRNDDTLRVYPSFTVGCVSLDVQPSSEDDVVIPCLGRPIEFRTERGGFYGTRQSRLTIPSSNTMVLPRGELPRWRRWEVGTEAVRSLIWGQIMSPQPWKPVGTHFLPCVEMLLQEATQTYRVI
jgi:hypothetical protein